MKRFATALLLSAAVAAPAVAADAGTFYGAIDLGRWNLKNSSYADTGVLVISGGYRMTPQVAAEIGLYGAGDTTLYYGGSTSTTASQGALTAAAVGRLPLNEKFELFGKLGMAFVTAKITGTGSYAGYYTKETTNNLMVGFGGQVNFSKSLGLRLQYEALGKVKASPTDSGADVTVTSMGLVYSF